MSKEVIQGKNLHKLAKKHHKEAMAYINQSTSEFNKLKPNELKKTKK